jgi:hypothetical protein
MGLTVVLFYTYVGVYGKNVDAMNIMLYFIAMAAAYIFSNHRLANRSSQTVSPWLCLVGICCMIVLFAVFSVYPPQIGLYMGRQPSMLFFSSHYPLENIVYIT